VISRPLLGVAFALFGIMGAPAEEPLTSLPIARWKGDLDGMIERRRIRVLVVPNDTNYFVDMGRQRGLTYDAFEMFGEALNRKLKSRALRVQIQYIPVERGNLFAALNEGLGDVASANLTITPERRRIVDFSAPLVDDAKEIIVLAPNAPRIDSLDDLAGLTVAVRPGTSYFESLEALNGRLIAAGKPPMRLQLLPTEIENEDKLEMLNAGLIGIAVVEDYLADFWSEIFTDIVVRKDLAVREGGQIALAFRKDSPQLAAALDEFIGSTLKEGSLHRNMLLKRYLKDATYARSATSPAEIQRFNALADLFRRYGSRYEFDHLLIMAQAYQESRLDHSVRSRVGAIGVMQVMPATGKAMKVGDIRQLEPNIEAGTKYLRQIDETYFGDAPMDRLNQTLFAFAAYNAGPNRIQRLRAEALARGLNPNVWFNNVEIIAGERIGRETVQYVSNIFKYYIAYRLIMDEQARRKQAVEQFEQAEAAAP
jgi:membrane-bound lytic murein transglycosylase MltF